MLLLHGLSNSHKQVFCTCTDILKVAFVMQTYFSIALGAHYSHLMYKRKGAFGEALFHDYCTNSIYCIEVPSINTLHSVFQDVVIDIQWKFLELLHSHTSSRGRSFRLDTIFSLISVTLKKYMKGSSSWGMGVSQKSK